MKDLNYKIIGEKIRSRRKALGITQEQVADYLEVNPSHISNIETGRAHPSLNALVNISNCLKCSMDCFINDEYTFSLENDFKSTIISKLDYANEMTIEKIVKIIDLII